MAAGCVREFLEELKGERGCVKRGGRVEDLQEIRPRGADGRELGELIPTFWYGSRMKLQAGRFKPGRITFEKAKAASSMEYDSWSGAHQAHLYSLYI